MIQPLDFDFCDCPDLSDLRTKMHTSLLHHEEQRQFNSDIDHIFTLNQRFQEIRGLASLTLPISAGYLLQTSIGLASYYECI